MNLDVLKHYTGRTRKLWNRLKYMCIEHETQQEKLDIEILKINDKVSNSLGYKVRFPYVQ